MDDSAWLQARESWERLRWARLRAGYETGVSAANAIGMKENTYTAYERRPDMSKATALDGQRAIQFGRKFRVSWQWLLTGDGTPFDVALTPPQQRVVSAMQDKSPDEQERIAAALETLLRTGT